MATVKWGSPGTYTAAFAASALSNLANGARVLGSEIDNSSNRYRWMDIVVDARFASAPAGTTAVNIYLIPAVDGTNYADGDGSVAPPATAFIAAIPVRAVNTAQKVAVLRLQAPPCKFKFVFDNQSGQATYTGDSATQVSYRLYSEEIA